MAKTAITLYLKKEIESGFQSIKRRFKNIKDLNQNFKAQRNWIFQNLKNRSSYLQRLVKILEIVKLHACKHLGIFYMTENHLCDTYQAQFGQSISKRSVATYLKHLRDLGFITSMPTKRGDGKQSANILVIEPLQSCAEAPCEDKRRNAKEADPNEGQANQKPAHKGCENLQTKRTNSSPKTIHKDLKERQAVTCGSKLLNFVPAWFRERVACITRNPSKVFEYWKITKLLTVKRHGLDKLSSEEVTALALKEFFRSAKAANRGKFAMQNPYGFFYAILSTEIGGYQRRKAEPVLYNWLEA